LNLHQEVKSSPLVGPTNTIRTWHNILQTYQKQVSTLDLTCPPQRP